VHPACVQAEVAALSAASSRYQAQIEGLQTLLVTKVSQCSRLEKELRDASKQLRQVEAASAADQAAMAVQLQQLSDGAAGLQEVVAAGRQREQQLEAQLAATRAKVRAAPADTADAVSADLTTLACICSVTSFSATTAKAPLSAAVVALYRDLPCCEPPACASPGSTG
jgi:septal ring factor EnvC (AmiA/AmiB activator)